MKSLLYTAAAVTLSVATLARAGETAGTALGARQHTTAEVHCDALSGARRESCLRALKEPDKSSSRPPAAAPRGVGEPAPPPVKAAPAQPPVEATRRAADPKAPSGAIIIDTPSGKLP